MRSIFRHFYFWVLLAIAAGGLIGHFFPAIGIALKPLGDAFIALVKMLIGPIIFLTVVQGVAGVSDVKKVGRVGVKAILYFEVVSTFALIIGLIVVNTIKPGAGFNASPEALDAQAVSKYVTAAHDQSFVDFFTHIIPKTFTNAFTSDGDLLQVLLLAVLFGFALIHLGEKGRPVLNLFESVAKVFFGMMGMIMRVAPLGALGAMAFTIGKYGAHSLGPLAMLMGSFYLTCVLFVVIVLGIIARLTGFSIFKYLRYIRDELLLVLGTSL